MSIQSAYDRMETAHCPAFQWIGQPLSSCDRCGCPYWDHSHDEVPAGPFAGKRRRVVISTSSAEKVRAAPLASHAEKVRARWGKQ